jgi:predicted phage terminase large subunit-like protein
MSTTQIPVIEGLSPEMAEQFFRALTIEALQAEKYSRKLREYVKAAWHVVEPSKEYLPNWHIDAVCEHLEAVSTGQIPKLLVNIPPACSKSLLTSVFWPTWEWAKDQTIRWFFASYDQKLSTRDSMKCRAILSSSWFKERWPNVQIRKDQDEKTYYETTKGGYRLATSTGGHGTGEHPDRIVVDDPHNTKEAPSEAEREATIIWWDQTMALRGVSRGARRVIIMQRLHENDLSGHILSKEGGDGWTHLCLPMRYEPKRMVQTPLGWNDPRTEPGELLNAKMFSDELLTSLEIDLGSYGTAGQMQQRPTPASGGAIKRTWWRYYDSTAPPADLDQCIQSWDTTMKGLEKSDYTVGGVLGRRGALLYVLDIVRGRMNTPETIAAVRGLSTNWPQSKQKLIEDKANGPAVISTLYNEIPGIIAMPVKGDKEQRVSAVTPFIEAGNVLLPGRKIHDDPTEPDRFRWEPAYRWVTELIEECAAFPVGSHDDQVDMLSQGLLYLSQGVYVTRHRAQEEAKRFGPPAKDMIEQHTREVHASLRAKVNKLMSGRNGHKRRGGIGL